VNDRRPEPPRGRGFLNQVIDFLKALCPMADIIDGGRADPVAKLQMGTTIAARDALRVEKKIKDARYRSK